MADFIITCPACSGFLNPDAHAENIETIPYNYMLDGVIYEYSGEKPAPEVLDKIANGHIPDIAPISTPEFNDYFTPILNSGKDILHINFSESYSPNCKYAKEAADILLKKYPERKIRIINSKRLGLGIFALANEASKLRKSEKSFADTAETVQKLADNNSDLLIACDLHYLKSKKYISTMQAGAAEVKREEVILKFDNRGSIAPLAKAKKFDGIKKLLEIINSYMRAHSGDYYIGCEPETANGAIEANHSLAAQMRVINDLEPKYIQTPDIFTISKVGLESVEILRLNKLS